MKANPDLIIEASSFTDSRGSDSYNLALSQRRAKAAVEYLISKGVDATRIQSKGYGEDKLINQCVNGVNCDEPSHQLNRRTEFNFVNNPKSRAEGQSSKMRPAKSPESVLPKNKKEVKESQVAGFNAPETIDAEVPKSEPVISEKNHK